MLKLKKNKGTYLLKHSKVMNFFVVNDESFILKALLLYTCVTWIFAICLIRFQQHHLSLDAFPN